MKKLLATMITALLITSCSSPVQDDTKVSDTQGTQTTLPGISVDASYLNKNLSKQNIVILDARGIATNYNEGHIPGAQLAPFSMFADGNGIVLEPSKLSEIIARFGITSGSEVIIYGDNSKSSPALFGQDGRLLWVLRGAGLSNVKILDGGYTAWTANNYTTSTGDDVATASNFSTDSFDQSLTISTEDVKAALNDANSVILDSRTKEEFDGAQKYGEARGGHLPGAVHLHYTDLLQEDSRFLPVSEMESKLSSLGVTKDKQVISYCTGGIRSAFLTMVLRELGYTKAVNYDASFSMWAADESLPLE